MGAVEEAKRVEGAAAPMTYAYYHQVKGGKTPPKASSYLGEEELPEVDGPGSSVVKASTDPGASKIAWRCTVCGHIEYAEELPADYTCPVCGVGRSPLLPREGLEAGPHPGIGGGEGIPFTCGF